MRMRERVAEVERGAPQDDDAAPIDDDPAPLAPIVEPVRSSPARRYLNAAIIFTLVAITAAIASKATLHLARASTLRPSATVEPATTAPASLAAAPPTAAAAPAAPAEIASGGAAALPVSGGGAKRPFAAALSRSKKCTPPYTFDREGHKIYKPECY